MTRLTSGYTLVANALLRAPSASGHAPTKLVGHVATLATTATKNMNKENTMEQKLKEAIKATMSSPKDEPKRYPVMFTVEELKELEDLIYERSNILDSMSEWAAYKKDGERAGKLSRKAIRIEKIAVRMGAVLDRLYVENGAQ